MMTKKILVYYCFLLAVFITISGIVSAKSFSELLPQVVFLPVTIYLGFMAVKTLRQKKLKKAEKRNGGKGRLRLTKAYFYILLVFSILLAISIIHVFKDTQSKIATNNTPQSINNSPPSISATPIPFSKLENQIDQVQYVYVNPDNELSVVNIHDSPSVLAKVIKKAKYNDKYKLIEEDDRWYKIELEDMSFGYLSKEVSTTSAMQKDE